ncbi:MAG: hypothetical protein KatS3mg076_1280 [Candidatus Binatia bacterium]|nr:MAG: hypothetical protein KatS3mg076_1280 [Candidatus Binatia bacterium]
MEGSRAVRKAGSLGRMAVRPSAFGRREVSKVETKTGTGSAGRLAVDPFGYDPRTHELARPMVRFFFERYWRVRVSGAEYVPDEGPAIVVANHSGAIPLDAFMIAYAVEARARRPRLVRFLYDRFVTAMPGIRSLYPKLGAVPASFENARKLLELGELVGLFPEGVAGLSKGFGRRYRLQPFRSGFVRLGFTCRAPVVPVAVVGAEETYPVLLRWERLGPIGKWFGVPYVPVTPLFPFFGGLGALPLPSRWWIRFGPPLRIHEEIPDGDPDPKVFYEKAQEVRRRIQAMVHELLAERPSWFS